MPNEEEAADAFGVLADPTRIAILRAFAEALDRVELGTDEPMPVLSFSDVYERVEIDSTSQLSYHLEKLDGTYLRHTEGGSSRSRASPSFVSSCRVPTPGTSSSSQSTSTDSVPSVTPRHFRWSSTISPCFGSVTTVAGGWTEYR
ncbi:ArsR family transcriptional regulator [Natrialba swarupiae]|nr:ArsR family transcriptional regulator [Natrialba swarupiae]